ncbi:MAG: hypothetical protein ABMB14_28490, partial [Myxococcota bacterium]
MAEPGIEVRTAPTSLEVVIAPDPAAAERGRTAAGGAFRVLGPATGPGCASGWARVEADGYVCLDGTTVTDAVPRAEPALLAFDPPEPDEYDGYVRTGQYDYHDDVHLVPEIYGRRWRRFDGALYASLAAFTAGEPPLGKMTGKTGERLGFVRVEDTPRGPVLVRDDGQVARLDDVYLYPVSRLAGRDLRDDPPPTGTIPAIAVAYGGTLVRGGPSADAPILRTIPYHTHLAVDPVPT